MTITSKEASAREIIGLRALSSIRDDVWHANQEAGAYEWWYFDAISDDGREALVIIFLAGFMFSPRYNRAVAEHLRGAREAPRAKDFPAVAVSLYRDGRPVWRAINEYEAHEFAARSDYPACRIGANSFALERTAGKIVYRVQLDTPLRSKRRLQATLAWEMCEGDFSAADEMDITDRRDETFAHEWNLVAPRCRVSGMVAASNGAGSERRQWAGAGYHDHNRDTRWMPATISEWQWGRAHFTDMTTIFYRYREQGQMQSATRLYISHKDALKVYEPQFAATDRRRHLFGLRYSRALQMSVNESTAEHLSLQIEQQRIVDSSFFYLRFLGEAMLDAGDGVVHRAPVITEQLTPRALRWRKLDWLTNMRIGRYGRAAFLP